MYFERVKLMDDTVASQVSNFLNNILLPFQTDNPLCFRLLEEVRLFIRDLKLPKQNLEMLMERFNLSKEVPKTKSRLCGGILRKGDRAYKCHDCITEENSIVCLPCFDFEKHKNHQFELIPIFGGCCDCGDQQKWKPDGFCKAHSEDEEIDVQIDPKLLARFIEEQQFAFTILLHLYLSYRALTKQLEFIKLPALDFTEQDNEKLRTNIKHKATSHLEFYSGLFLKQLIDFNKCGKYANSMTERLFQTCLKEQLIQSYPSKYKKMRFFDLLFIFVKFDKTPEHICQLCITLFQLKDFRETITIKYMQRYTHDPCFSTSNYAHLSSQLFTSYLAISKLVRERCIPPLEIFPELKSDKQLYDVAQAFVRFYYDINYLSKLYGEASIEYFRYHAELNKMVELAEYRRLFNQIVSAKDYYGIEEIFINRILNVVRVMQRDKSRFILKASLRQLYQFISSYNGNTNNYFRPQERFFTLVTLAFCNGQLDQLDDNETMIEYLAILGIDNLQKEMKSLIENTCTIFSFAASLIENVKAINANLTFYSFYLKKGLYLFNLDAILLKIIIKICVFHNAHHQEKINYSQIIKHGDKFFNIIPKFQAYSYKHIENQFNTSKDNPLSHDQTHLKHLINYIDLINEAVVSDLPLLAIKCFMQLTKQETAKHGLKSIDFEDQAKHYYRNILKCCENTKVSIKDFKIVCDSFFKEEDIFKQFVSAHIDVLQNRRLDAQMSKGEKISLHHFKSNSLRSTGLDPRGSINHIPFFKKAKNLAFIEADLVKIAENCLQFLGQMEKSLTAQGISGVESTIQLGYKQLFYMLWTMYIQTKNQQIYYFVAGSIQNPQLKGYLTNIAIQVGNLKRQETSQVSENETRLKQEHLKKELRKEKLSSKKNQMKEKMNKNKDLFITNEEPEQVEKELCCICKEINPNEGNCYVAMISKSNYNNWAGLSPDNQLCSINACRHFVHRTCYTKSIKKNQIYSFCPLCKKPMNIIIPKHHKQHNLLDEKTLQQFWGEFHKINRVYESGTKEQQDDVLIFQSLACFVVIRGLLFPKLFVKELKTYRALVNLLIYYANSFENEPQSRALDLKFKEGTDEAIQPIFTYFLIRIYENLYNVELTQSLPSLSHDFTLYAEKIIALVFSKSEEHEELLEPQLKEIEILRQTVMDQKFQNNLNDLSNKFTGKCPNCQLVTNHQAICLICPKFVTCFKCENVKLMTHAEKMHKSACSFLKTSTGEVVYIFRNRFWIFESIYEDYMGRIYSAPNPRINYNINLKKLESYKEDIVNNAIESRLRYKEKQSNKVNHDQEL